MTQHKDDQVVSAQGSRSPEPVSERVAFKGLTADGRSPFQRRFQWPLPSDQEPGDWVQIDSFPRLGDYGFHAFTRRSAAEHIAGFGTRLFEVELDGEAFEYDGQIVAQRARLLRELPAYVVPSEPLARGIRNCTKCGKPHDYYQITEDGMGSWEDRTDGHVYYSEDWAVYAARWREKAEKMQRTIMTLIPGSEVLSDGTVVT